MAKVCGCVDVDDLFKVMSFCHGYRLPYTLTSTTRQCFLDTVDMKDIVIDFKGQTNICSEFLFLFGGTKTEWHVFLE